MKDLHKVLFAIGEVKFNDCAALYLLVSSREFEDIHPSADVATQAIQNSIQLGVAPLGLGAMDPSPLLFSPITSSAVWGLLACAACRALPSALPKPYRSLRAINTCALPHQDRRIVHAEPLLMRQ